MVEVWPLKERKDLGGGGSFPELSLENVYVRVWVTMCVGFLDTK